MPLSTRSRTRKMRRKRASTAAVFRRRHTMRRENDDFRDRYARAREGQADHYFHEMIEIADEPLKENVEAARARNRIDVRKFAVARLAPKKYGDRVSHDVQGVSNNFRPKILIQCSSGGEDERDTLSLMLHPKQLAAFRSKATE